MIALRLSQERGFADHGWLRSYHSFSFAGYYDPAHMGWGNLRVINEDWIAPGTGFGTHSHRDMEILTYVLAGELAHKDSLGNVKGIPPGDVQRMSAGTGVQHSEFNHATGQTTHLLQIWIAPHTLGVVPSYEQLTIEPQRKQGCLALVASGFGEPQSVHLHADARVYAGVFEPGQVAELVLAPQRKAYVHLVRGSLVVNGVGLRGGDAALLANETHLCLGDAQGAEVLVFDLSE
jgi:hypothetical protein